MTNNLESSLAVCLLPKSTPWSRNTLLRSTEFCIHYRIHWRQSIRWLEANGVCQQRCMQMLASSTTDLLCDSVSLENKYRCNAVQFPEIRREAMIEGFPALVVKKFRLLCGLVSLLLNAQCLKFGWKYLTSKSNSCCCFVCNYNWTWK